MKDVGMKIVKKCKGLPLAIRVTGEGFLKAEGELSMEDLADSYYEELITRSLLQVVYVSTIGCSIVEDIVC
ncbi:hypothetical protein QJS10_CPB17g00720 [Acorus calamus]|uniref:Disease resistance protein winged helix domain-containing protein n=1 Tax=Acorus calamus TaxID=4465 RepID=A0AAV9CYC4_ACOCL|nr:hypothetical protein QJS10_CPB17g00720 [Acorus calamus]